MRWISVLVASLLLVSAPAHAAGGGEPPRNPHAGPVGTSTMHGDSGSSDTFPMAGPGAKGVSRQFLTGSVCPTILAGADGMPITLCTRQVDRAPVVSLLDPDTGRQLATRVLDTGSLLGGVYAYVDDRDRLVTVDGSGDLLLIGHARDADGDWRLSIERRLPVDLPEGDAVTTVAPGFDGRVWFATAQGRVGTVREDSGRVSHRRLGLGESVANSISTSPDGVSVVTDHATYLVRATAEGAPRVVWRREYDRGDARKPGQLSRGGGASPTFFGPRTGHEYIAVTDNASPREHLLVYRARTGRPVCSVPVLEDDSSGTENSPIGRGRSVVVASTYGYPYPAVPEGAGESSPRSAPFAGGMERIDVTDSGCRTVWRTRTRSAAVPRLSVAEGVIYTVVRGPLDGFRLARISPRTGRVLSDQLIGVGFFADTLQMVGTVLPDGTLFQGNVSGYVRVRPRR